MFPHLLLFPSCSASPSILHSVLCLAPSSTSCLSNLVYLYFLNQKQFLKWEIKHATLKFLFPFITFKPNKRSSLKFLSFPPHPSISLLQNIQELFTGWTQDRARYWTWNRMKGWLICDWVLCLCPILIEYLILGLAWSQLQNGMKAQPWRLF